MAKRGLEENDYWKQCVRWASESDDEDERYSSLALAYGSLREQGCSADQAEREIRAEAGRILREQERDIR